MRGLTLNAVCAPIDHVMRGYSTLRAARSGTPFHAPAALGVDADPGLRFAGIRRYPDDIAWIAALIARCATTMVVIDVLAAYLSGRVDSHKDQSVRRLLAALAAAAAKTGAAVILIRHHNKAQGMPALYCGGGSIGIIGATRAAQAVVRDPDDNDHRLLATVKSDLAVEAPT
jgi:AAA domain